ncbi:hypothetical protein ACP4OV_021885 [Aristida adscensionis]
MRALAVCSAILAAAVILAAVHLHPVRGLRRPSQPPTPVANRQPGQDPRSTFPAPPPQPPTAAPVDVTSSPPERRR